MHNSSSGGGGGFGGNGGGQSTTAFSPGAGCSKQQEASWTVTPDSSVGGAGMPGSATGFGGCHPGGAVAGNGVQYGSCGPGAGGGNVNHFSSSANMGMPASHVCGTDTTTDATGASDGGLPNIGSSAGVSVVPGGFGGISGDHNPLAGGVPVLPDVSGQSFFFA